MDQVALGLKVAIYSPQSSSTSKELSGRRGERGFADSRLAEKPWIHRQVLRIDYEPRGEELPHSLFLANPSDG